MSSSTEGGMWKNCDTKCKVAIGVGAVVVILAIVYWYRMNNCTVTGDCKGGKICSNGKCLATGVACTDGKNCVKGSQCVSGVCKS